MSFANRLEEMLTIRTQHDELILLLSPEEQKRFNVEKTFDSFKRIQVFMVNPYTQPKWDEAKAKYDSNMQSIEAEIANKLRREVIQVSNIPQQMRDFQKWQGLLSRPNISRALQSEREQILSQLCVQVESIREEFETRSGQRSEIISGMDKPPQDGNMSPAVSSVVWARGLQQKISRILASAGTLLSDLSNISHLKDISESASKALGEFQKQQFNT